MNRLLQRKLVLGLIIFVSWVSRAGSAAAQVLPSPAGGREGAHPESGLGASSFVLVTSDSIDRERSNQLRVGVSATSTLLLRSASSLTAPIAGSPGVWKTESIAPQFLAVINSQLPFSQNNGALWAGKGPSTRTLIGVRLESDRVRIILAPEIILSANASWPLFQDYYHPPVPAGYSPTTSPTTSGQFTIDQPMRFGDQSDWPNRSGSNHGADIGEKPGDRLLKRKRVVGPGDPERDSPQQQRTGVSTSLRSHGTPDRDATG